MPKSSLRSISADLTAAIGDQLVEQRLRVSHRAIRLARDGEKARIGDRHLLRGAHELESVDDLAGADAAQVVALAARHHREGDLLGIGRAGRGRVADRGDHLAHVIDTGAARGVDFLHVRRGSRRDLAARRTLVAGRFGGALVAVEAAGQDARECRLAHAAWPREEDGVGYPLAADRVAQGRRDVGLAGDLVEALRTPLPRQNLIRHRGVCLGSLGWLW
jgi:hypothetical protein